MTSSIDTAIDHSRDQRSRYQGITWERFKLIEQGFSDSPGVRLFYHRGVLEILSVSPEHEIFSRLIGFLIQTFLTELDVDFQPTGSMTQKKPGETSLQADESYCIGAFKHPSDLAIEIVFRRFLLKKRPESPRFDFAQRSKIAG